MFVIIVAIQANLSPPIAKAGNFSFSSLDTPFAGTGPQVSTITVAGSEGLMITDVNVFVRADQEVESGFELFVEHTPTGTSVELTSDEHDNGDEIFNTFDDQAPNPISERPPFGLGAFQPEPGSLTDFNGIPLANGDNWQLTFVPGMTGAGVFMDSWRLDVATAAIPEPQTYAMFTTILIIAAFMKVRNLGRGKRITKKTFG